MALTQTQVSELYVAIFGRVSEKEGSDFWSSLPYDDFIIADGMLADPTAIAYFGDSLNSNQAFIEHIYFNTFGRTVEQDPSGIAFWVDALDAGYTKGFIVTEIIEAIKREPADSPSLLQFNNRVEVSNYFADSLADPDPSKMVFQNTGGLLVDDTADSVEAAKLAINDVSTQTVFTLKQATTEEITEATYSDPVLVTMWGYNPHGHDETNVDNFDGNNADSDAFDDEDANEQGNATNLTNEGIEDGGVPLSHLIAYIEDLANLDFTHLDLLGDDHDVNVSGIDVVNNDDGTVTITVTNSEGEITSAEVEMSDYYFNLIHDAIFDSEGNSRLFQQELYIVDGLVDPVTGGPVYATSPQEVTPESSLTLDIPTVLTTTDNNGGVEEGDDVYTSALDDLIVVGRLDLLHGAYIDAGEGDNVLEIDAKGHFAQPKALLNIQTITIQNLPNIYTDTDNVNQYPDVQESNNGGDNDSIIDISRAVDLENLTVSEGDFESLDAQYTEAGDLTVTGIRNGATVTIDGHFDSDDLNLHFRETAEEGVNLVLFNANIEAELAIAHNATVLNIESAGAGNVIDNADLSAHNSNLTQINVTGDAKLFISSSLEDAFADNTPATIDASANTAGVDLSIADHSDEIVFIGTAEADDHFYASGDRSVTITGGNGNNEFEASGSGDITITAGEGDNEISAINTGSDGDGIELEETVTVTVGNGQNDIYVEAYDLFAITAGDGDNRIEASGSYDDEYDAVSGVTEDDMNTIVVGDGQNEIDAFGNLLSIVTGNGDNEIHAAGVQVLSITTGTGNDVIVASGDSDDASVSIDANEGNNTITVTNFGTVVVSTGAGDDSLTIEGGDLDFGTEDGGPSTVSGENGDETSITVDLGAGTNTLTLDSSDASKSVTATPDSTITGENITLVVQSDADLSRATVSGVTSVQLGNADSLTLTVSQFLAMGGSTSFSVIGESFNAKSYITLIVEESVSLDDLNIESLPRSIDLAFEIKDGAQLEMTAQQLHERVISEGVSLFVDDNTDFNSGTVLITDAGIDFDPFNNNDQVRTADAGANYLGGSLGTDFVAAGANLVDGVQRGEWGTSVLVDRVLDGYIRPVDAPSYSRLVIDTDQTPEIGPFETIETFLRIVGDSDLTFTPATGGIDEWGRPQPEGTAIELATDTDGFLVDFSSVTGSVNNLTLAEFQKVDAIYGNGDNAYARVNVELNGDVATAQQGLISDGVQAFVVTEMNDDDWDFYTCETTKDLEVLGLRGNYGDEISFLNTERGVEFLMETVYVKADGYVVGQLHGEFARSGADAVVNVVALDTLPSGEVQMVEGITLVNADTATINVTGGDANIMSFSGGSVTDITLTADADVTFPELATTVEMFDASGVVGTLTTSVDFDVAGSMLIFEGAAGATTLTIGDAAIDDIASIDGVGEIALIIGAGTWPDTANLTETALNNVTSVTLSDLSTLSVTMEQADTIGAANFHVAEGDAATLNLVGLNDQVFSLANYDVDGTLTVTLTLANEPVVTLNALTDLTGITSLNIPEGTVLELTAEQFMQLEGATPITGTGSIHITDLTQAAVDDGFDLDGINLTAGADGVNTITITAIEDIDFTGVDLAPSAGTAVLNTVNFGDSMMLTFDDLEDIDGVAVVGGTDSIVKFTDVTLGANGVDAAAWSFSQVQFSYLLVNDTNVDFDIFIDLPESIEKVIYVGEGVVRGESQVVYVEAAASTAGGAIFNKSGNDQQDVEITEFTLNLQGGSVVLGDLELSTTNDKVGIRAGLDTVTINSTGTDANIFTGETANTITGALTGIGSGAYENNTLTDVIINADQVLEIDGGIVFNSWSDVGGDAVGTETSDGFLVNDAEAATATVTVNGSADVALGVLDTSDDEIDALTVNNAGTGAVTATINGANIDSDDALAFTGSNIALTVVGTVDLSDDDLSGVTTVTLADGADLTLSFSQVTTLGVANIMGTAGTVTEDLTINGYDGSAFDFTSFDEEIDDINLVLDGTDVTLDGSVNLTGVDSIDANGGSLTLTAEQFQQLNGTGTITNAVNVTITGLTQAIIDAGSFDLSGVVASGDVTVDVVEDVNLSDDDDIENATSVTISGFHLGLATHEQADDLVVTGGAGSIVTLLFDIDYANNGEIEAAGYGVETLRAIANTVAGLDVDVVLDNLPNSVTKNLYEDPEQVGYVSAIHQVVTIEDGVAVPGNLIFNAQDDTREMRTLTINFEGDANDGRTELEDQDGNLEGSVIDGDLILHRTQEDADLTAVKFQTLTLNSAGTGDSNAITGDITAMPNVSDIEQVLDETVIAGQSVTITVEGTAFTQLFNTDAATTMQLLADQITASKPYLQVTVVENGDGLNFNDAAGVVIGVDLAKTAGVTTSTTTVQSGLENNLLDIVVNADSAFTIGGDVIFSSTDADATAEFTVTGSAPVTVQSFDVTDGDIIALAVANTGTSLLTVTGASPSVEADGGALETITLSGTGAMYFGTAETVDDQLDGIDGGSTLSTIDASGLSGALTIEALEDLDEDNFAFTAGTGQTIVTLTDSDLDAQGATDAGWSFDMTNAAAGSELHLDAGLTAATVGSALTIDAGANTTIYVDQTMDLTDLVLSLPTGSTIVVADAAILTLTAAQADGLTIIGANGASSTGVVNLTMLGSAATDLSNISGDVAGTVTINPDDNGDTVNENDVTLDAATDLGEFTVLLTDLLNDGSLAGQTIRFTTVDQADNAVRVGDFFFGDGDADATSSVNVAWLFDSIGGTPVDTSNYDGEINRLWLSSTLIDSEGGDVEQLFTTLPNTILRVDFGDISELDILLSSNAVDRVMEITNFNNLNDLTFSDTGLDPVEHLNSLTLLLGGEVTVGNIILDDVIGAPGYDPASVDFTGLTIESYRAVTTGDLLATEGYVNDNDGVNETGEYAQPNNMNTVGDIAVGADNGIDLLDITLDVGAVTVIGDSSAGQGADLTVGDITFETDEAASTATLTLEGDNDITIASVDASDADITTYTLNVAGFTGVLDPALHLDNTEAFVITDDGESAGVATLNFEEVEGDELTTIDFSASDDDINITLSQIDSNDDDLVTDAATFTSGTGANVVTLATVNGNTPTLDAGSTWNFDFTNAGPGSELRIEDAVFGAGSTLNIDLTGGNTTLFIDDDVDLTGVNLVLTGATLEVVSGATLTLTVPQVEAIAAAGLVVVGEGTVAVIDGTGAGEDGTDVTATDFNVLRTAGVDLSGVTVDGTDATTALDSTFALAGSISTATDVATITITADDVDDGDETITINYTVNGGAGALDGTVVNLAAVDVTDADAIAAAVAAALTGAADLNGVTATGNVVTFHTVLASGDDVEVTAATAGGTTVDLAGALSAAAAPTAAGIAVTGSNDADIVIGTDEDDTYTLGTGDDTVTGGSGDDTFNVTSGTDTITDLGDDDAGDVLVVSAGATAAATTVAGGFVATADTMNDGTATITSVAAAGVSTVDMSLVTTGTNGFTIDGDATDNVANTLIGSDLADTINGGDSSADSATDADVLTGGAGADVFVFDIQQSTPLTLTETVVAAGEDYELVDWDGTGNDGVAAAFTADTDAGILGLSITYRNNDTVSSFTILDDATILMTDGDALAARVATELTSRGVAASYDAGTDLLTLTGTAGQSVEFISADTVGGAAWADPGVNGAGDDTPVELAVGAGSDADDVPEDKDVTIETGTAVAGEIYSITLTYANGTGVTYEYTAAGGENQDVIAAALDAGLEALEDVANDYVDITSAGAVVSVIAKTGAAEDDEGGFTLTLDNNPGVSGTGASALGAGAGVLAATFADTITDFVSGEDTIQLNVAGTNSNYLESGNQASYNAAYTAAEAAFDGTVVYYLTSADDLDGNLATPDASGMLFFDANGDGSTDGVIMLTGITSANFDETDIIA